jgi:hypothetical protein
MRSPARGAAMRGFKLTCGTIVVMASQKTVESRHDLRFRPYMGQ